MRADSGEGKGFREVDIAVSSVQDGRKRFPTREEREATELPAWRNNLTVLSQEYNLYFVAHKDQIHAYEPDFPSQNLTRKLFSWTVPISGWRAHGIFPRTESHWVNRMVLEYLGYDEVIATVHDDGDFIVCTLRSVRDAIAGVLHEGMTPEQAATRIKYLYQRNVAASAWGIAIHTEARLLAVSANSCRVTVFAPALWRKSTSRLPSGSIDRHTDWEISLRGHRHNIPALAFCNTGVDPEGRYLVSTDITGEVIIWDIWIERPIKQFQMAPAAHLREDFPGWSVTCLDSRSFLTVDNELDLAGRVQDKPEKSRFDPSRTFETLQDSRSLSINDPRNFIGHGMFRQHRYLVIAESEDGEMGTGLGALVADEPDEDDLDEQHAMETADDGGWNGSEYDELTRAALPTDRMSVDDFEETDDWGIDFERIADELSYDAVDFGPRPATDSDTNIDDLFQGRPGAPLRLPPIPQPTFGAQNRSQKFSRRLPPAPQPPGIVLPFSILHTGQKIVTLLRPPFTSYAAKCVDPCMDRTTLHARLFENFDRLNLTVHIPELSVVVLGTQIGRAAVMTLTELIKGSETKPQPFQRGNRRRTAEHYQAERGEDSQRYALRLDWVLPLQKQENQSQRPFAPLVGLAASPIQNGGWSREGVGLHRASVPRRWRLMLTYKDNSVLSYELSRGGARDETMLVF